MHPIPDDQPLHDGDLLYHTAFGFAVVAGASGDELSLDWERGGGHLPRVVPIEAVRGAYLRCVPGGFLHRTVVDAQGLRDELHSVPGDGVVTLLDELGGPQRVSDIMDWMVGRGLFTPKTFVRWWGVSEPWLRSDPRLIIDGEWVRRRETDERPLRITQLEPDLVSTDALPGDDDPHDDVAVWDLDDDLPRHLPRAEPTPLAEARLGGRQLVSVGVALAEALAAAHADPAPTRVRPTAANALLLPDGSVTLPAPAPADDELARARADDVHDAAVVLLEALCGRELPPRVRPSMVLPHLRHRVRDLPPSAMAPLLCALHREASSRPDAAAWLAQWRAVADSEARRAAGEAPPTPTRVGFDSHVGRVKLLLTQTNQDSLYVGQRDHNRLLVLADGISVCDAGRGDLASRLTTSAIGRLWENLTDTRVRPRRLIERGLALANTTVCERASRLANGDLTNRLPMGTTVTVAYVEGNRVHLSWLGDSRAYLLGPWGVSLLTADDNVSGERFLLWCDGLSRAWSPSGHALVRYVGHFDEQWRSAPFPAHHATVTLLPGERLLLCSDGVTDYIEPTEPEVAATLWREAATADVEQACHRIVALSNRAGGGDNISVIVLEALAAAG